MKPLFILGRTRRSVATLGRELTDFEHQLGLSDDDAMMCGDLAFWPLIGVRNRHRFSESDPISFWEAHAASFRSEVLSEWVIGEFGRNVVSAGQTEYIDDHRGQRYAYGKSERDDDDGEVRETGADDRAGQQNADEWDFDELLPDPYDERTFQSVCVQEWFENLVGQEDVPSFGRKLLTIIGRDPERRFLQSPVGQRLRASLGQKARVVLNAQGANAAAIAFEAHLTPRELFWQIKRLLPPRLVEDFLIVEIGMKYCTGEQPISVFAEWDAQQRNRKRGYGRKSINDGARGAMTARTRTSHESPSKQTQLAWLSMEPKKG